MLPPDIPDRPARAMGTKGDDAMTGAGHRRTAASPSGGTGVMVPASGRVRATTAAGHRARNVLRLP